MEIEDLKCCGNCEHYGEHTNVDSGLKSESFCHLFDKEILGWQYCNDWGYDEGIRSLREILDVSKS